MIRWIWIAFIAGVILILGAFWALDRMTYAAESRCEFVTGQWSRYCPEKGTPQPPPRPKVYPFEPRGEPRTGRGGVYK